MSERTWEPVPRHDGEAMFRTGGKMLSGQPGAVVYGYPGTCWSVHAWAPGGADGFRREMRDGCVATPEEAQRLASRWLDEREAEAQQRESAALEGTPATGKEEAPQRVRSLDEECPVCQAAPGAQCQNVFGRPWNPHILRPAEGTPARSGEPAKPAEGAR